MTDHAHEYFCEILTEEIPAWMHDAAQAAIRERLVELAQQIGGDPERVSVTTTPRRIVLFLPRLPLREPDREQEVKGPPKKAAWDATGNPTQALLGFLKKNGATIDNLIDSGDEYVRLRRQIAGRTVEEILAGRVPEIVETLRWPKTMRWGSGEHAYIRPIHSVVSLFDDRHVPITILGVASGTTTVGHRTLAPRPIDVHSYSDYVAKLELARVVVDATRRRHVMAERARILANEVNGTPAVDASIWVQWQYLTEYPGVVRAEFRREYLALPEEVLVTVMRVHQKQLPIRDAEGKLTHFFLAVLDNESDPEGNAAYGNSFVTNARFADAKFFYETDRKRRLADRLEQLEHLQFQEKLGNYREKTARIETIAAAVCAHIGLDPAEVTTAARLCKTDLVTEMVKEFTDLQGRIGGIYAREEGYPEAVWQAIYDHYQPVSSEDALPRNLAGAVVSLADRIDTLYGFFSIGIRPRGSSDPFALRRAAQGLVQILLNRDSREVKVGVDRLVEFAAAAYGETGRESVANDLLEFIGDRLRTLLESQFAYDEIAAAMAAGWAGSLPDVADRAAALRSVREDRNFLSILDSAKRIENIAGDHRSSEVDPARLEHEVERRLDRLATVVSQQIDELIAEKRYRQALESFAAMAPELETFFREVMVMVDDEAVRKNRMSLLRKIGGAVGRIADVTKIVVDRREYRG
ncbi:MAG TPA: glycine--tRNA ligase subunit beta [Thermoanaerobaculia bacterium]|nr:glycine--tRNA ligase subunit beta [Thermoanaerobaculia bacterium]